MLTRREVLIELQRIGIKKPSMLKLCLRDFENYMAKNYGLKILKKKAETTPRIKEMGKEEKSKIGPQVY